MGVGELVKFQVVRVCQVSNLGLVPAVNVQNSVREFLVGMLELGNDASRSQYAGKSFGDRGRRRVRPCARRFR